VSLPVRLLRLGAGLRSPQVWQLIDSRLDGVPFSLAVPLVDVGAGVADDVHADLLRDLEALHPGDEGGAEAVEALPGLLAPAGGGVAGVDAGSLDELDEEGAWARIAP